MTTAFPAKFENGILLPQEPAELHSDQMLDVVVIPAVASGIPAAEERKNNLLAWVQRLANRPGDPESPGDLSAQHAHYLYGISRRENP
jgi:hypothetical protein